jgi:hypothetical protein
VKPACSIVASVAVLFTSAAGVAQGSPRQAQGDTLLASCRANEPQCGAYLQGVLDQMIVNRKAECGAPRYDRPRLREAYLRWAEADTYFRDKHMVAGAEQALNEAWPCRTQR